MKMILFLAPNRSVQNSVAKTLFYRFDDVSTAHQQRRFDVMCRLHELIFLEEDIFYKFCPDIYIFF